MPARLTFNCMHEMPCANVITQMSQVGLICAITITMQIDNLKCESTAEGCTIQGHRRMYRLLCVQASAMISPLPLNACTFVTAQIQACSHVFTIKHCPCDQAQVAR